MGEKIKTSKVYLLFMQARELLERLLGIPTFLIGAGLVYVGVFTEYEVLYVFFYVLLGLLLLGLGVQFILGGIPYLGQKEVLRPMGEVYKTRTMETKEPDIPPRKEDTEFCTSCGAPLTSAGKFCGSCGALIQEGSPAE